MCAFKLETLSQVLLILVGKLSARNAEQLRTILLGSLRVLRALVRVGCLAFPGGRHLPAKFGLV